MPLARKRCQVSTCTETTVGVGTSTLFHCYKCVISTIININQQNYCRPKVSTKPHFQLCDKSVDKFALQMYLKSALCKKIAQVKVSRDLETFFLLLKTNNFGAPGGPTSTICSTIYLDPLYFEVNVFLGPLYV